MKFSLTYFTEFIAVILMENLPSLHPPQYKYIVQPKFFIIDSIK